MQTDYKSLGIQRYIDNVRRWIRAGGTYNVALMPQVRSLASALRQLDMIDYELRQLTAVTYVEKTAYGEKIVPHPLFAMQDKALNTVNRYCKSLGLMPREIMVDDADDNLTKETRKLISRLGEADDVVRPD